ncbi:hypothetical protein L3C95_33780 [Chitinophaga filiformis]|uniref:hypothetical protein n=1 Tax=Chitinophaga filiformis TaxID=104663 RepID=UPI001F230407|nr:hypothetical protein [Chitinophaga filiformis]MCF6407907.1 hypothetical protein [Chitinophaga filiformis]
MRYILLFAGVLLFCNCRTSQTISRNTNSPDTLIRFNAWGLPYFKTKGITDSVNRKWGFYEDYVIGCGVLQTQIDSLTRDNEIAARPLVAKYGKNWHKKYERDLSLAFATPAQIIQPLHFSEEITKKRDELQLVGDTLFYHFKQGKAAGTYKVDVVGWQRQGNEKRWVSYYKYYLSHKTIEPKLLSNKIRTDPAYLHNNVYFLEKPEEVYPKN